MGPATTSIESSGYPLVFPLEPGGLELATLPPEDGALRVRTYARTLRGMQKEAIIQNGPAGAVWRVVCDEGAWLNGSDLAPFPLAFFTAGLAASLLSEILGVAAERGVPVDLLNLVQDNFFTMEGSALRGTMVAGAQPMQLRISIRGSAAALELQDISKTALRDRCPAIRCLREAVASGFAVRANAEALPWPGAAATHLAGLADPAGLFGRVRPVSINTAAIIRKSAGATGGSVDAVGLKADQKRVVHVHTEGTIREDGMKSIKVRCLQPTGSCFEILSDDSRAAGGRERAPDGLAYLAAGAAFCFMTQIGRYARIAKHNLHAYRIIQDTAHQRLHATQPGSAFAVETLVCLDTDEPPNKSIELVKMGQQTCYVHAAFRSTLEAVASFQVLIL